MPATISPEGFQAHQGFIAGSGPKLSRAFKAALILTAGGLDGTTAHGLSPFCGKVIIQPVAMGLEVFQFGLRNRAPFGSQALGDGLEFGDCFDRSSGFEFFEQWLDPLMRRLRIVRMQRVGHCP